MASRDWAVQHIHECIVGSPCRCRPDRNLGLHAITPRAHSLSLITQPRSLREAANHANRFRRRGRRTKTRGASASSKANRRHGYVGLSYHLARGACAGVLKSLGSSSSIAPALRTSPVDAHLYEGPLL